MPIRHEISLRAPVCTVLQSASLGLNPVGMKIYVDEAGGGMSLGTMVELACNGVSMSIRAGSLALLSESAQSVKYIDDMTIGTLDPMKIGDVPTG